MAKKGEKVKEPDYIVVKGFNIPDGEGGEKRYDVGTARKPSFVDSSDFDPEMWKKLLDAEAVVKRLEAMTKAELVVAASQIGLTVVPDSMNNDEIIDLIRAELKEIEDEA